MYSNFGTGNKGEPYTEQDGPHPINIYGASKLAGEQLVQQACPEWFIVRTATVFGKAGAKTKRGNFIEAILSKARAGGTVRVINDTRMSPTYAHDAARVLEHLVRERSAGLFHVTNHGGCTLFEFAKTAMDMVGLRCKLEPVPSSDYPTKAQRPRDSRLESVKLDPTLIGSFLDVCIARLPKGQSVVSPSSHCPACRPPIPFYDNIPFLAISAELDRRTSLLATCLH